MSDFDYGGEVAENKSGFKQANVGTRNARLYSLLRIGSYREIFRQKGKAEEVKAPAPYAFAIFHLLGKADKEEDGSPMFFVKGFPLKKGDKSFLHSKFIPAFGGFAKHKGFGTMTNQLVSLNLKGSKEQNEDGTPKYVNFGSIAEIGEDTLELLEGAPQYAALPDAPGFILEGELTAEHLKMLAPVREFADVVMQTEEFKAGTHPAQAVIQALFDSNPELYTRKAKDDKPSDGDDEGQQGAQPNQPQQGNALPENLDEEETY